MIAALRMSRLLALTAVALVLGSALLGLGVRPGAAPALAAPRGGDQPATAAAGPLAAPETQIFGSWVPMGSIPFQAAEATSAPAAVSWGAGRLDVFVRGRSGELFQNFRDGVWFGWRVPEPFRGVILRSAPACASWGAGRLSCVALVEGDNAVWHFFWDGRAWARESLGGVVNSAPTIASNGANQLAVFVAGERNQLFGRSWVRGQWSEWANLDGELRSAPSCAAWSGDTLIQCFVTSTQNWIMRQEILIGPGSITGRGYVQVSMRVQNENNLSLGSAPSATATGPGRIALTTLNAAQVLYATTWANNDAVVWTRYNDINSLTLNSVPSCATVAGRLECFARGPDSRMLKGFGDLLQSVASIQ